MLRIEGLDVVEGMRWKVRELDLELAEGQVLALLGGVDAGKSALLGAIAGVRQAKAGRVLLRGVPLDGRGPDARLAAGIALSAQRPALFEQLSVREHLLLGACHRPRRERPAALARALELVPELSARRGTRALALGLVERRLLDIARALASRPALLLLDEPCAALGPERVAALIGRLRVLRTTVLLAERLAGPALAMADRGCLLLGGRIVLAGEPAELAEDPRVHAACLGEASGL